MRAFGGNGGRFSGKKGLTAGGVPWINPGFAATQGLSRNGKPFQNPNEEVTAMKISLTFRNSEGESWQKEYIEDRLKKLNKYIDHPSEARVVLSVEKFRNVADINLTANGMVVNAKEEAKDMHLAIDEAVDKIERRLKKHRERIRGHKKAAGAEERSDAETAAEESEESSEGKILETRRVVLKPMSVEDALMELEAGKNQFIIFRDSSSEQVAVIYRAPKGKFVLLETKG
jgi:putative sigma-54 modulation protein